MQIEPKPQIQYHSPRRKLVSESKSQIYQKVPALTLCKKKICNLQFRFNVRLKLQFNFKSVSSQFIQRVIQKVLFMMDLKNSLF